MDVKWEFRSSTHFSFPPPISVIPKLIAPTLSTGDENNLVPQWAVVVMVVGLVSLLFVIIFGVAVVSVAKGG